MLDQLLQQLGKDLDMAELIHSDEPGHYILPFADEVNVEAIQLPQSCYFKSTIGPCPKDNVENFFTKVMEANLYGRGNRGTSVGLSEDGNVLTLSMELDYNSTYKDFRNRLDDFLTVIDFWREEAAKHR